MRAAFETVYDQLSSDDATKAYIDAIGLLKDELAAAPEVVPACPPAHSNDDPIAAGFPEGTYQMSLTADDWRRGCEVSPTLTFLRRGSATSSSSITAPRRSSSTSTAPWRTAASAPTTCSAIGSSSPTPSGSISARWSFDGESLTFTDLVNPVGCDDVVVLTSHPWVLVADADP